MKYKVTLILETLAADPSDVLEATQSALEDLSNHLEAQGSYGLRNLEVAEQSVMVEDL